MVNNLFYKQGKLDLQFEVTGLTETIQNFFSFFFEKINTELWTAFSASGI